MDGQRGSEGWIVVLTEAGRTGYVTRESEARNDVSRSSRGHSGRMFGIGKRGTAIMKEGKTGSHYNDQDEW